MIVNYKVCNIFLLARPKEGTLMNHDYNTTWENKMVTLSGIRGSSANQLKIILLQ